MRAKTDKTAPRFCLVQDSAGDWYIAPSEKRAQANTFIERLSTYHNSYVKIRPPLMPKWLERLDSLRNLTFTDPSEQL